MKEYFFSSSSLRVRVILALVLATSAVFMTLRCGEFPVGAGMDDAYYVEMARSLAEGRGPVIHLNDQTPAWRPDIFPLGFPLLLAPLARLVPDSVQVFKIVPVLALVGLAPLCLLLGRVAGFRRGLPLAALVCLNPWAVAFAVRVFSDLPFTAVSMASIVLFLELIGRDRPSLIRWGVLAVLTGAAVMIRTVGLALPLAMALCLLSYKRWWPALWLCCAVAAALLPHALVNGAPGGGLITGAYLDQVFSEHGALGSRAGIMAANLMGYFEELLQFLAGLVLLAGVMWGWISRTDSHRIQARFVVIYLVVYGGALLNFSGYPSGVQTRLLLPVLPLLYLGLFLCFDRPAFKRWPSIPVAAVMLILSMAVVHNVYRTVVPLHSVADGGRSVIIDPGVDSGWIRTHTGNDEMIMTRWPLRQHIHFLRPVVGYGTVGPADLNRRLERFGVDHIWLGSGDSGTVRDMRHLIEDDPRRFKSVHHDVVSGTDIFSIRKYP